MPPPEGEQRCYGAYNAGQAQHGNPVSGCYDSIGVAPQSRAQRQLAARTVGDRGVYFTYERLLRSVMIAVRMQQDGRAQTTLVISVPVRVFASNWKIPDIQAESLQSFAAQLRSTGFRQAAEQITLNPVGSPVPTRGFVEAIR